MVVYLTTINYISTKIILIKMEVNLIKKALYYFVILSSFRLNSSYNCRFWGKVKKKLDMFFFRRFFSKFDLKTNRSKYFPNVSCYFFRMHYLNMVKILMKAKPYKKSTNTFLKQNSCLKLPTHHAKITVGIRKIF